MGEFEGLTFIFSPLLQVFCFPPFAWYVCFFLQRCVRLQGVVAYNVVHNDKFGEKRLKQKQEKADETIWCSKVRQFLREIDIRRGYAMEGLLRISAPTYAVRGLWAFIASPDFSLVRVENIHIIAATFKMYLREQRTHVLHRALYVQITECMRDPDPNAQISGMRYIVGLLDPLRRLVLYDICTFCLKILAHAQFNKMDRENVAICLAPSIIEPDTDDPLRIAQTAALSRAAFALLLSDLENFFPAVQVARDIESVACPPDPMPSVFAWVRLTELEWEILLSSARLSSFATGEIVLREGEPLRHVYRIHSGACSQSIGGSTISQLLAADVFGLTASLGLGHLRGEGEVIATQALRLYELPVASLENALVIDSALAVKWYCTVSVGLALRVSVLSRIELEPNESSSAVSAAAAAADVVTLSPQAMSPAVQPQRRTSTVAGKHSSTAMYGLRSYPCRWVNLSKSKKATFEPGVLAVTATHLAFERERGRAQQPAALFVPFMGLEGARAADRPNGVTVMHGSLGATTFVFDDDRTATELVALVERIVAVSAAREERVRAAPAEEEHVKWALCIRDYTSDTDYHLTLRECDRILLIKDDPKEELWYGEAGGREGYFNKAHVTVISGAVPPTMLPSPTDWALLGRHAQIIKYARGDVLCAAGDGAAIGLVQIVREGVCVLHERPNAPDHAFFVGQDAVFGELGALIGAPLSYRVTAFSETVTTLRLDCRDGSIFSALLRTDVELAARFFRFVAAVCALRVDGMVQRLAEMRQRRELVRQRVSGNHGSVARRRQSSRSKVEFEEDGLVLIGDDSSNSGSSTSVSPAPGSGKVRRKKGSRRKSTAPTLVTAREGRQETGLRLDLHALPSNASTGLGELVNMLSPAPSRILQDDSSE